MAGCSAKPRPLNKAATLASGLDNIDMNLSNIYVVREIWLFLLISTKDGQTYIEHIRGSCNFIAYIQFANSTVTTFWSQIYLRYGTFPTIWKQATVSPLQVL